MPLAAAHPEALGPVNPLADHSMNLAGSAMKLLDYLSQQIATQDW